MSRPQPLVVSLLNTPAGRYRWYEDFPRLFTAALAEANIRHVVGYKSYSSTSTIPDDCRLVVDDDLDAPSTARLRTILNPILRSSDRWILHTHSYPFGPSRFWRLSRESKHTVWWATYHRTPVPRWGAIGRTARGVAQNARILFPDKVFGCGKTCAAGLRQLLPADRVGELVNGRLTQAALRRDPREGVRTLLFVGRMIRGKGVWQLVRAMPELASRLPGVRLIMVGDGVELIPMQAWVTANGLDNVVEFAGHQVDVEPYYRRADLLIAPTDPGVFSEGLGLVPLEAQGHALPTLYSVSGGLRETQVDGKTGLMLGDIESTTIVARCLELAHDLPRYHAMREFIVTHRTEWLVERMVDRYVQRYVDHFARH